VRRVAALLKGVNVGGSRKLPMADLKRFLVDLGYADATTLLASGNAVFASDEDSTALEARLEREAKARLGLDTAILIRDAADLDALIAAAPHADAVETRPQHVLATFMREAVDPALLDALAAAYHGPERLVPVGRELVIDFPCGVGDSKLDAAMRKLKFPSAATARNWNTVGKLRAMLG